MGEKQGLPVGAAMKKIPKGAFKKLPRPTPELDAIGAVLSYTCPHCEEMVEVDNLSGMCGIEYEYYDSVYGNMKHSCPQCGGRVHIAGGY